MKMAFPEAVETITEGAFEDCTGLTSIHCDGVTQIGPRSFKGCTNLTGITMSDVQTIGNNAFEGCEYLGVSLPPNVSSIGADVFSGTTFTEIYYENTAASWRSIQKDVNWLRGSNITTVYCTDTDIPASSQLKVRRQLRIFFYDQRIPFRTARFILKCITKYLNGRNKII